MRRVVVTGIGLVSPLAYGVEHSWKKLINSESGIGKITLCKSDDLACKIAGEAPESKDEDAASKGLLNLDSMIEPKDQRKMGRFIAHAIAASEEAVSDSGWKPTDTESQERTGVLIGAGIGGLDNIYENAVALHEKGPRRVSPYFIISSLINEASGNVSIRHGFKGPNHSVVTACSTGAHAIGDASRLIQLGDADVMLAGGAEACVGRLGMSGFSAIRALSTKYNDDPTAGSRPWDEGRDGFVMGEGAGVLVLEELEHAKKRGAKIYCEVTGYGLSGDAYHVTAPAEDGDGAYRAMKYALKSAKLNIEDIDYINAHGTSTPKGDMIEIAAIKRLFDGKLDGFSMSSTKSSTGHLLGAAGAVEAIFCIKALQNQIAPPTLNLHNPSQGTEDIDLVPLTAKKRKIRATLSNSFGFGGTNASLVFTEFK